MATNVSHFGNSLGNGLTGTYTQHRQREDLYDIGYTQLLPSELDTQPAGPTAAPLFTGVTTFEQREYLPSPDELENLPQYPLFEPLDQYAVTDLSAPSAQHALFLSQPASHKRDCVAYEESPGSSAELFHSSKRKKRKANGYTCTGCPKLFDLKCEARKHFKAAHTSGEKKCTVCSKQFHWAKDVRRHLKQVHSIGVKKVELTEAGPRGNPLPHDNEGSAQAIKLEPPEPVIMDGSEAQGPHQRRRSTKMSISKVLTMMKALSLMSSKDGTDDKAENGQYILITQDQQTWTKVTFQGVQTSEELRERIVAACAREPGNFILHHYHARNEGKRIWLRDLMSEACDAIAAKRTLHVSLTTVVVTKVEAA